MHRGYVLFLALAVGGCTSQSWYEGLREGARQQCRQTPDASGSQDCIDKVNRQDYESYKAEREKPVSPVFSK